MSLLRDFIKPLRKTKSKGKTSKQDPLRGTLVNQCTGDRLEVMIAPSTRTPNTLSMGWAFTFLNPNIRIHIRFIICRRLLL